jgi:predicted porin
MEVVPLMRRPFLTLEKLQMKKTLVALAAFSAVASYAQVTLTGNADVGYRSVSVSNNTAKNLKYFTHNNSSTSAIFFTVKEDLGGGLKANFFAEADFAPSKNALQNSSTTNNGFVYTGGFFNSEVYVGLEGDFGNVKLGAPNSPALEAAGTTNPFGTALGGGYSDTFGRLGANANVGINGYSGQASTARIIRSERAMVLTTPTFNGVTAQVEYSAKNSNATYTTTTSTSTGTNVTGNNNGLAALALKYNQGPLNAMYYSGRLSGGGASGTISSTGSLTYNGILTGTTVKYDIFGANYTVGAATAYIGYTKTKSSDVATPSATVTDVEDSKSTNYAIKYAVNGNLDVMANRVSRSHNVANTTAYYANNGAATLTGFGADYKFSKMTNLYVRWEKAGNVNVWGTAANSFGDQTISAVGLRVKF